MQSQVGSIVCSGIVILGKQQIIHQWPMSVWQWTVQKYVYHKVKAFVSPFFSTANDLKLLQTIFFLIHQTCKTVMRGIYVNMSGTWT